MAGHRLREPRRRGKALHVENDEAAAAPSWGVGDRLEAGAIGRDEGIGLAHHGGAGGGREHRHGRRLVEDVSGIELLAGGELAPGPGTISLVRAEPAPHERQDFEHEEAVAAVEHHERRLAEGELGRGGEDVEASEGWHGTVVPEVGRADDRISPRTRSGRDRRAAQWKSRDIRGNEARPGRGAEASSASASCRAADTASRRVASRCTTAPRRWIRP